MEGEYPAIKNNDENKEIIRHAGYHEVSSLVLAEAVWRDDFYKPMPRFVKCNG